MISRAKSIQHLERKMQPLSRTHRIRYGTHTHQNRCIISERKTNDTDPTSRKAKCIKSVEDLELIESDTECKRIEKLEIGLDDPYLEEEEEEE